MNPTDWDRCAPWLERALDPRTHGIEDVRQMCERGDAHFWGGQRGAIVTEFVPYPRRLLLNFWLVAADPEKRGGLAEVLRMEPVIRQWATERGATLFTGGGRHGWSRALKALGYQAVGAMYERGC